MKYLLQFELIPLCFLIFLIAELQCDEKPVSLYNSDDDVLVLNSDNFAANVFNQKRAFFVEFYSSYCGACIGYAPKYKKFAKLVKSWKPIVEVAAVNCADEENLDFCRKNDVDAFPTIKYFKYMSKSDGDGKKYLGDKHDLDNLPLNLAQQVQEDWRMNRPNEWPNFDPILSSKTIGDIWQSVPTTVQLLAVIVEGFPPRTAWAEMIAFANDSRVHIVTAQAHHDVVLSLGVSGATRSPILFIFQRNNSKPIYTSGGNDSWLQMELKIMDHLEQLGQTQQKPLSGMSETDLSRTLRSKVNWTQFEVQMQDIMTALYYMFKAEIPRKAVISGNDLSALKQWLNALKKYAPGTIPMRRLFHRLNKWILAVASEITAKQWLAKVDSVQADLGNPLPSNTSYMSCRGSQPFLRGFSCGVWTLIHTMSVEAYKIEKNNLLFNASRDLIEPFHQFVWHFFSCEDCAKNFHNGILKKDMSVVVSPSDGVLWLWRTHNIVNKFIAKTPTDDPAFPKQQFPSSKLCSSCQNSNGEFNEQAVFSFLVNYYGNIKTDSLKSDPEYQLSEFEGGKLRSVKLKHLKPQIDVGAFNVEKLEETEERLINEQFDGNAHHGWKNIGASEFGGRYENSSTGRSFSIIWLSMIAVVVQMVNQWVITIGSRHLLNSTLLPPSF